MGEQPKSTDEIVRGLIQDGPIHTLNEVTRPLCYVCLSALYYTSNSRIQIVSNTWNVPLTSGDKTTILAVLNAVEQKYNVIIDGYYWCNPYAVTSVKGSAVCLHHMWEEVEYARRQKWR